MSGKNFINERGIFVSINSIKYKKVEAKKMEKRKSVRPIVTDNYKVIEVRDTEIEVEYTRKLDFKPKAVMNISIVLSLVYGLNEDRKEDFNHEQIISELDERREELLAIGASNSSMIIGNLSNVSLPFPIITPPFYTRDNEVMQD